mgnify:CR=1 FL=1
MNSGDIEEDVNPPAELYAYHATSSFSHDTAMPYLSYFAVRLGASFEQIAVMQSLMNLLPMSLQHFWGWISDKKMVRTYLEVSRDIFRTPIDHLETPQFTTYEEQDHYQWHIDAGIDHSAFRDVSATMLLSQVDEDFTGGMLKFFPHPSSKHYFDRGDMILFSSNYAHRVCRVTAGTRYSIGLWGGREQPSKVQRNKDLEEEGSWGLTN